jgi:hypothetical protein
MNRLVHVGSHDGMATKRPEMPANTLETRSLLSVSPKHSQTCSPRLQPTEMSPGEPESHPCHEFLPIPREPDLIPTLQEPFGLGSAAAAAPPSMLLTYSELALKRSGA